jgi:hypothetical protein
VYPLNPISHLAGLLTTRGPLAVLNLPSPGS